jgi:hypothetical protein
VCSDEEKCRPEKMHEHITMKGLFHSEKLVVIIEQDLSDKK